jgi:hypothetical protein
LCISAPYSMTDTEQTQLNSSFPSTSAVSNGYVRPSSGVSSLSSEETAILPDIEFCGPSTSNLSESHRNRENQPLLGRMDGETYGNHFPGL